MQISPHLRKRPGIDRQRALMWPPLKIAQHGARGEACEQTLNSFESALREGAEGIALEVQVPRLSEIFAWVRNQRCLAFVGIDGSTPDVEVKLAEEIGIAKVHDLVRVISGDSAALRRMRRLDARFHLGLQFDGRPPALREAEALGAEVLLPHWRAISPSFIRRAHGASMLVIPWTVDSPREMRSAILKGVDGIITNYPAKLTQTVARIQTASAGRRERAALAH